MSVGTESVRALLLGLSVNAVDGHETTGCITVFGLVTSTYILVTESRLAAAGTGIQHLRGESDTKILGLRSHSMLCYLH